MQVYMVGGAVRDRLMGLEPRDVDYVVVGETPESMKAAGFEQVGQDFPVFLKDGEEYALARAERKVGEGYTGFEFEWEGVTLEDDLMRRDLTVNSIAVESFLPNLNLFTKIVDPFNGYQDIKDKILRHTSDAFKEDPVRVLRLARFRARLGSEWTVASETVAMVSQMSKKGVLNELQPDRVWKEFSRAMTEPNPRLFFDTLLECDALHTTFPLVYKLLTALEARRWHPEGNAYEHTMLVLTAARKMGANVEEMFACLCHDLGKGLTKFENLPKHYGHDVNGVPLVDEMAKVMSAPSNFVKSAKLATRYHMYMHDLPGKNAKTLVKMFDDLGANQQNTNVSVLRMVGAADARGRLGYENESLDFLDYYDKTVAAYRGVKFGDAVPLGKELQGKAIGEAMRRARVNAVANVEKG